MQPFAQPFAKYILYCGLHLRNRAVVKDRKVWHKKKATDFVEMVALLNCPLKKIVNQYNANIRFLERFELYSLIQG